MYGHCHQLHRLCHDFRHALASRPREDAGSGCAGALASRLPGSSGCQYFLCSDVIRPSCSKLRRLPERKEKTFVVYCPYHQSDTRPINTAVMSLSFVVNPHDKHVRCEHPTAMNARDLRLAGTSIKCQ